MQERRSNADRSQKTRGILIQVARTLFFEKGYAATGTPEVVETAGVTRGALYHHFGNKEGLFQAVVAAVQHDVAQRIVAEAEASTTLWAQLLAGCHAFLKASLDPEVQRILLVDAPAVLGWEQWRKLDAEHSMQTLHWVLTALAQQGLIKVASIAAAVHLLSGAMNEAALWIAQAEQPETALAEAMLTLEQLLNGLRSTASVESA